MLHCWNICICVRILCSPDMNGLIRFLGKHGMLECLKHVSWFIYTFVKAITKVREEQMCYYVFITFSLLHVSVNICFCYNRSLQFQAMFYLYSFVFRSCQCLYYYVGFTDIDQKHSSTKPDNFMIMSFSILVHPLFN